MADIITFTLYQFDKRITFLVKILENRGGIGIPARPVSDKDVRNIEKELGRAKRIRNALSSLVPGSKKDRIVRRKLATAYFNSITKALGIK